MSDIPKDCLERIEEYKKFLSNGDISESEYNELIEDLANLEKLSALIEKEDTKVTAQKVADSIMALARVL